MMPTMATLRYKRRIDRLLRNWSEFRSMVGGRLGTDDLRPEEEGRFLALKGRVAEQMAGIAQEGVAGLNHEIQAGQREISDFLNRHTTLQADAPLSDTERAEFEREWHRLFLYLNKLRGLRPRPAAKPAAGIRLGPPPARASSPRGAGFGHWFVVLLLRLGALALAVWAVVRVVPWDKLPQSADATDPGKVKTWASAAWVQVKTLADNMGSDSIAHFFRPVVERYGAETTAVLVGVLLLAVGYWLFVRTK